MDSRNWVSDINLHYDGEDALVTFILPEPRKNIRLTMDQADSLSAILRDWVRGYQKDKLEEMKPHARSR